MYYLFGDSINWQKLIILIVLDFVLEFFFISFLRGKWSYKQDMDWYRVVMPGINTAVILTLSILSLIVCIGKKLLGSKKKAKDIILEYLNFIMRR